MLRSVSSASLVKGSFMKNDVVSVSLWGGKTFSLEFWNRKSSEFITWMLNAIPAKCREWSNDRRCVFVCLFSYGGPKIT